MANNEFFSYKGRPLVRCGNELYYGDMTEPYVIRIVVKSDKDVQDLKVTDDVSITLMSTDPNINPRRRVIKTTEKKGLYIAMDIADVWLSRELSKAKKEG